MKEKIRSLMWEKVGVEKSDAAMRSALEDIEQIRHDLLSGMRIANPEKAVNYEWLDAIDVVNMVDACELIIHSSLERKESRGPFFRQDFPLTDNANWLAANVLEKSGNGMRFEKRKYDLPIFQPDFVTKNNLEVAW
jgi:succinate dehydrogenase/fumarate reductase flavoprotein subunit